MSIDNKTPNDLSLRLISWKYDLSLSLIGYASNLHSFKLMQFLGNLLKVLCLPKGHITETKNTAD